MWGHFMLVKILCGIALANSLENDLSEVENIVNTPFLMHDLVVIETRIFKLFQSKSPYAKCKLGHLITNWVEDYSETSLKVFDAINNDKSILTFTGMEATPEEIVAGHPLLVYRMIRRFTHQLKDVLIQVSSHVETKQFHVNLNNAIGSSFPTEMHLNNSIRALYHIQEVFDIQPIQMANGEFSRINIDTRLELSHVVEIGIFGVDHFLFSLAAEWLSLAKRLSDDKKDGLKSKIEIDEGISKLISQHDLYWDKLSLGNDESDFSVEMFLYTTKIHNETQFAKTQTMKEFLTEMVRRKSHWKKSTQADLVNFYALCKGELLQSAEERKSLKCYYERAKSAELQFFPAKIEELSNVLKLMKIHQLIGPIFSTRLKELSKPNQYNPKYTVKTGNSFDAAFIKYDERQAMASWVQHSSEPRLLLLKRRLESITGLNYVDRSATEPWNVIAYAPGGSVTLHHDLPGIPDDDLRGRRISTLYIYMHTSVLGGQTPFPTVGVAPTPEPGSAIFWENIQNDGSIDYRGVHGACPVLFGSKWALLSWATEHGNFMKKRCLA